MDITQFGMPSEGSLKTVPYNNILKTLLRTLAHTADRYQGEILKVTNEE
jgi:hypothetical protein